MDWSKLETHAKVSDLVRNGAGVIVGICSHMERNKKVNPVKDIDLIIHRLNALVLSLTIIMDKIDEKTNQK